MATIIEAGDYRAKAVGAQLGETSNHNEQISVRFALLDFPGQHITYYGTFTDAAFEYTMKAIRAAGFKGEDISDLSSLADGVAPEVVLVVVHEEYNDKTRAKIRFINSVGGMALKSALQPDQAKSFAQRLKGKILAFDKAAGTPSGTRTAGAKPPAPRGTPRPVPASSSEVPQEVLDAQEGEASGSSDLPF